MREHLAASTAGNPALAQFVLSVLGGVTVLLLGYMARLLRQFMGEHKYLMAATKQHSEAIEELLRERRKGKKR